MILGHLLERPGDGALLRVEAAIEVDRVFLFEVQADEGGIRDALAVVVDVGELALGGLGEALGVRLVGQAGQLQQQSRPS